MTFRPSVDLPQGLARLCIQAKSPTRASAGLVMFLSDPLAIVVVGYSPPSTSRPTRAAPNPVHPCPMPARLGGEAILALLRLGECLRSLPDSLLRVLVKTIKASGPQE